MKEARVIPLTQGYVAIVDAEDFRRVNRYKWRVTFSGGKGKKKGDPYARGIVKIDGKKKDVYLHRWLMGVTDPNIQVDHKNHCTLDCRRSINLEETTPLENNKRRRNRRARGFVEQAVDNAVVAFVKRNIHEGPRDHFGNPIEELGRQ